MKPTACATAVSIRGEVDGERTVIISERRRGERAQFLLDEEIRAAAFKVHGYHHGTIGWQCDLEQMTR
ncbi:hypothetical protein [Candidatus Amarobacter glycogenicus]|uniref:hypothetical protein n=1 Tax=Candidatus Amarobacter glycogenicus TaxID=3140699 RepID=UPI002A103263|nr:hypothetical protein [Dehalococcoidia bacterium]